MTAVLFTGEAADRVIDQTIRGERRTDPATGDSRGGQSNAIWAFVKITGPGSSLTGWPGKILFPSGAFTFDEDATITVFPTRGRGLSPGDILPARLSYWDDTNSRSTWHAVDINDGCCDGTSGSGGCSRLLCSGPQCIAVTIVDGAGYTTVAYAASGEGIPTVPGGGVGCLYRGVWSTPNDSGTFFYGQPEVNGFLSCTVLQITGQNGGGSGTAISDSEVWQYPFSGNCAPIPANMSYGGDKPPKIVSVCAVDCGSIGFGGGGGGIPACKPCDPAVDNPCYKCRDGSFCSNVDACFGGGTGVGGLRAPVVGGTSGGCGCSGGGSTSPASSGGCSCSDGGALTETAVTDLITATAATTLAVHAADAGNTLAAETDLHVDTIAAKTLANDDDSIALDVTFLAKAGVTPTGRVYFGGVKIFESSGWVAGVVDTPFTASVTVTRKSATTARATVKPSTGAVQYTDDATLTGLDFTAAITLKSTGQGGSTNDIKAVQSIAQTLPAPGGATVGLTVQDRDSAATNSVPTAPADYAGAGAAPFYTGPSVGLADVPLRLTATGPVTTGNVFRVWVLIDGVKVPKFQVELRKVAADPNQAFQLNMTLPKIKINGPQQIYIAQEGSDSLVVSADIDLYQAKV